LLDENIVITNLRKQIKELEEKLCDWDTWDDVL
jgi:hypothetical protein